MERINNLREPVLGRPFRGRCALGRASFGRPGWLRGRAVGLRPGEQAFWESGG